MKDVIGTNIARIRNNKVQKNNTSGYPGVTWHEKNGKWVARITFRGRTYHLGYFENKEEAINTRKKAESLTFEDFLKKIEGKKVIVIS